MVLTGFYCNQKLKWLNVFLYRGLPQCTTVHHGKIVSRARNVLCIFNPYSSPFKVSVIYFSKQSRQQDTQIQHLYTQRYKYRLLMYTCVRIGTFLYKQSGSNRPRHADNATKTKKVRFRVKNSHLNISTWYHIANMILVT